MTIPIWITNSGSIGSVNEGDTFGFTLSATNNVGPPFSYTLISGELPPGLALDPASGTISGTIPLIMSGSLFQFTVRATNLDGIADRTFSITVIQDAITWNTPTNLGLLAPVINESYFSLLLSAVDPGDSVITYTLISGELPAGLDFQPNGYLSGYLTAISDPIDTYTFTIRATGATSSSTRTFTMNVTSLGIHSPQWNTISAYNLGNGLEGGNLGNLFNNIPYSFQLESVKPTPGGPGTLTYSLVAGYSFPPGISMNSSGLISGTLSSQAVSIYPLLINVSDGLNSVSSLFYLRTNYVSSDLLYWVVNENEIPVNLSLMTAAESINFNVGLNSYQITKNISQTSFSQALINQIIITNALPQATSLIVVQQSAGIYTIYQNYSGQLYNTFTLTSITPPPYVFNLGSVDIGQNCVFKVSGISLSPWVRYEIVSGSLPAGLDLNINTGDIEGTVQSQAIGIYNFVLRVYNFTLFQDLNFGITITQPAVFKPNKLTARISEFGKIDWYTLLDLNLIPNDNLYRPSDNNFGQNTKPEVVIISEMDDLTVEQIYDIISDVVPTTLTPENFIYTPVIDENANVICEALLLKFKDNFRRSAISYTVPVQKNPAPNAPIVLHPGGLEAIRQTFINLGNANNTLENWMNLYFTTNLIQNQFMITGILPDFYLGDAVLFHNQILPSPFENDLTYYVIPTGPATFQLAATLSDAQNGTFIPFNVNDIVNMSGTLQFYFPAIPIAYIKTGEAAALMTAYNNQQNIVPFGYYTMSSAGFTDVFFTTQYGHKINTGDPIQFWDEPIPGPFVFGYIYYVIVIDPVTFQLAESKANAINDIAITITGIIDDRTNAPYSGSFKKLLLTENNAVVVNEANTRFNIPVEQVYIDSKFKLKAFTASSSTGIFNLPGHNLEDTSPVDFYNQLNMPTPFVNDTAYYAIVIDNDNFQLALTSADVWTDNYITFTPDFSGYLDLDTAKIVFLNSITNFNFYATYTNSLFVANQTARLELGYTIQLVQTKEIIPAPFLTGTNYYVVPTTNGNAFRLATSLINAQNAYNNVPGGPNLDGTWYIEFSNNFIGAIMLGNNFSEYDWRR